MITSLRIKRSIMNQILQYCIKYKPEEACGFLLGTHNEAILNVEEFTPVPNVSVSPSNRFIMDPAVLISVVSKASIAGLYVIGTVHSHPSADAAPSLEDLQTEWHTLPVHCIVSLLTGPGEIQAYSYAVPCFEMLPALGSPSMKYNPLAITVTAD
jgi:proteasome lid subunit RPN8/RPN11